MRCGLLVSWLAVVVVAGLADVGLAQTNYFFRHPSHPDPPPPAGLDGNWFTELDGDPSVSGGNNWFDPNFLNVFIPDFNFGELARIENGGTAIVDSIGGIAAGQIILGSPGGTSGTLEVQDGGVLASRINPSGGQFPATNGNITVGSAGGIGTLRVLPGGTLTGEGQLAQGTNAANLIVVGGLAGSTATLSAASAVLPSNVQVFPNAAVSVTGGLNLTVGTDYTVEITGNMANGKIDAGGTATLAGVLHLNLNGYTPSVGHNWTVVEAGTINGNFSSIDHNVSLAANQNLVVTKPDVGGGQIGYNVSLQEVLVLEVNRDTGAATIKHPGSASIVLDGYFVGSTVGSLSPGGRQSVNGQGTMGNDWVDTGATATNVGELKIADDGTIAGGDVESIALGSIFDAAAGPFGQQNEDLIFSYRRSSDGAQFPGRVEYTGTKVNTLLLQVDPTGAGDAFLRNTSTDTVLIDGYEILSPMGRLTTTGWDSFDEQNFEGADTWLELDSNANQIGEVNQIGFTTLGPGASLNLGPLYLGGAQDLEFNFLLMEDTQGDGTAGFVVYEAFAGVLGDYNGNGVVDAADYTAWRDRLGQNVTLLNSDPADTDGVVTMAEYNYWKSRFGATSGAGSGGGAAALEATAVPEPATWMIAALAGFLLSCQPRRIS